MKKIFYIVFTVTALLAFASIADAQYGPYSYMTVIKDPDVDELLDPEDEFLTFPKDNGLQTAKDFAYSKNVSAPFSNGVYWIKLESYATGSASRIEGAAPADIVLVLDLSSSMTGSRSVNRYDEATTPSGGWTFANIRNGNVNNNTAQQTNYYFYYETDQDYYRVYRQRQGNNGGNRTYRLFFTDDSNTTHYLNGDTIQNDSFAVSGTNTPIYTGTLYTHTTSETRLDALKRATKAFIDQIELNDKYEDKAGTVEREGGRLGNRISLITFNSSATTHNTLAQGYLKDAEGGSPSTADYLKGLVDNFTTVTGTTPYNGFVAANAQLATIDASRMAAASRTVVFFTDGEPYDQNDGNGSYPSTPNNAYRYKAIAEALKSKTKDNPETADVEGYDATVYSVGLFSSSPTSGSTTWNFLNYVSSNAPNATAINNAGADFDANGKYYYDASDDSVDLTAVFTEIASQSGGTTSSLSAASSNVDVVSNSFILPFEVTAASVQTEIKVFIAKVDDTKTKDAGGVLDFNEGYDYQVGNLPATWTYQELDENGAIKPNVDPKKADASIRVLPQGTNGIKVVGFDYSSCFCGPIYEDNYEPTGTSADLDHVDHYQGYKIIIMIPIKMNPDAVGGPNCDTNAPGSGIYATDGATTAYVSYKSPDVSLPYNIHIKKTGLKPGESAKFTISRAQIPSSGDWTPEGLTYKYVTSVFVTQPMGASATNAPVVKVRGLPSIDDDHDPDTTDGAFIYKVEEEAWAWSYHRTAAAQYTDKSKVDNPFTFDNDKKDGIEQTVRHAESKVNNIFNGSTSTTRVYIDSKTNTGEGRY